MNTTIILCLAISLGIAFLVMIKPLFLEKQHAYYQAEPDSSDFDESISLLEAIAELESDFKMGKLSGKDFEALSLEYKHQYLDKVKAQKE